MIPQNWHEIVPPTMHISISEVKDGSASDCGSLEGDYLLSILERSPNGCRWELAFPTMHDFSQIVMTARPDFISGEYELRAFFEGTVAGPQWSTNASAVTQKVDLLFDAQAVPLHSLRCQWPAKVIATPMQAALPTRGHHISPSPTQSELAATMAASSTSCSSFDPTEALRVRSAIPRTSTAAAEPGPSACGVLVLPSSSTRSFFLISRLRARGSLARVRFVLRYLAFASVLRLPAPRIIGVRASGIRRFRLSFSTSISRVQEA